MSFCTAINCMDGRIQLPVNTYLRDRLGVDYVDTVTEPGPVQFLANAPECDVTRSILRRVNVSIDKHGSTYVAIIAHADCAGNPAPKEQQIIQLSVAVDFLAKRYPNVRTLGLWVNEQLSVSETAAKHT